jgi:hypothetical protein
MAGIVVRNCLHIIDPRFGKPRIFENIEGKSGWFDLNIIPQAKLNYNVSAYTTQIDLDCISLLIIILVAVCGLIRIKLIGVSLRSRSASKDSPTRDMKQYLNCYWAHYYGLELQLPIP